MRLWPFRRRHRPGSPDIDAFFHALSHNALGRGYRKIDRYRDFRAVFLHGGASPGQAQRVLWQILSWCRLFGSVADVDNTNKTYFRDGARNIGLRILSTLNAEPPSEERPREVVRERPDPRRS